MKVKKAQVGKAVVKKKKQKLINNLE